MGPKALVTVGLLCFLHDGVDRGNDQRRIAPGVVARQQVATESFADKSLGCFEDLRFCTAKAVNALLGVAHHEHAGRLATRACVAAEPGAQCLPLQRVGVLKLVNQQVLDARIKPLLHPA